MIINIIIHIFIFSLFFLVPIGFGIFLKKIILDNYEFGVGEYGVFGFLLIFFLSQLVHIFFPINLFISSILILFGISYFVLNFSKIRNELFLFLKSYGLIFVFALIASITINLHDDVYLYQLPKLNYLQQSKLVFGIINLNDFLGFNVGFYEIMAIFQIPFFQNQFTYILPVIFLIYFIFFLRKNLFETSHSLIKIFIYIVLFILLLRFSRSKEYGADIPVLCSMFMAQIYVLKYFFSREISLIYKSILIIPFSIFLKVYAIFSVLLFIIFISYEKRIDFLFKEKRLLMFICFFTIITLGKNVAQTGCVFYPTPITCLTQNSAKWSIGKDLSKQRSEYLEASTKGLKAHIRNNNYQYIEPAKFLKKYKYSYFKNILKDSDFERMSVVFGIIILVFFQTIRKNNESIKINSYKNQAPIILVSSALFLLWLTMIPHLRYGGYNYITFFIFTFLSYFNLFKYFNLKNLNIILVICCIYFLTKNLNRIKKEYLLNSNNYPVINFKKFKFLENKINDISIKTPLESLYCGNISFLCSSSVNMIKNIYFKGSYLFIEPNNNGIKTFFDETEKSEAYILNK